MTVDNAPVGRSKHGELTLDQLCELQPGMARFMMEVSDRFSIMYYAAKAGAWQMARHQYSEMKKALQMAGMTRPKYAEPLAGFTAEKLKPVEDAIRANDWSAFDEKFREAADAANEMHGEFGYEYIIWQLPDEPPKHLKL
jgi:hypothetical protein